MLQISKEFREEIDLIFKGEKCLSFSSLKQFIESPLKFYQYKTEKKDTEAMFKGKVFHKICLEPEDFENHYYVLDDSEIISELLGEGAKTPRATKKYKDWKAEFIQGVGGKQEVKEYLYLKYKLMSDYLRTNSATKDYFINSSYEEKATFEHDGLQFICYVDILQEKTIDLKKVTDSKFKKIRWLIEDELHHMQGAIYNLACKKASHDLIYIDENLSVNVVKLTKETLQKGYERFEFAVQEFYRCAEEDAWLSSNEFFNGGYINY